MSERATSTVQERILKAEADHQRKLSEKLTRRWLKLRALRAQASPELR